MDNPADIIASTLGATALALAATLAAVWRYQIMNAATRLISRLNGKEIESKQPPLVDLRAALEHERQNRRDDVKQVRDVLDAIDDRVNKLEQFVTSWRTQTQSTNDLLKLQNEVQTIANRLTTDLGELRSLMIDLLKSSR